MYKKTFKNSYKINEVKLPLKMICDLYKPQIPS